MKECPSAKKTNCHFANQSPTKKPQTHAENVIDTIAFGFQKFGQCSFSNEHRDLVEMWEWMFS